MPANLHKHIATIINFSVALYHWWIINAIDRSSIVYAEAVHFAGSLLMKHLKYDIRIQYKYNSWITWDWFRSTVLLPGSHRLKLTGPKPWNDVMNCICAWWCWVTESCWNEQSISSKVDDTLLLLEHARWSLINALCNSECSQQIPRQFISCVSLGATNTVFC